MVIDTVTQSPPGGRGAYFLAIGQWGCAAGWGRIFTAGLTISLELLEWDPTFSDLGDSGR